MIGTLQVRGLVMRAPLEVSSRFRRLPWGCLSCTACRRADSTALFQLGLYLPHAAASRSVPAARPAPWEADPTVALHCALQAVLGIIIHIFFFFFYLLVLRISLDNMWITCATLCHFMDVTSSVPYEQLTLACSVQHCSARCKSSHLLFVTFVTHTWHRMRDSKLFSQSFSRRVSNLCAKFFQIESKSFQVMDLILFALNPSAQDLLWRSRLLLRLRQQLQKHLRKRAHDLRGEPLRCWGHHNGRRRHPRRRRSLPFQGEMQIFSSRMLLVTHDNSHQNTKATVFVVTHM